MKKSLTVALILTSSVFLAGCTLGSESTTQNTTGFENPENKPTRQELDPENRPTRPELDLESAADTLGVTIEALQTAMGNSEENQGAVNPRGNNLDAAAESLEVSVEELREALGLPEIGEDGPRGNGDKQPVNSN